MRRHILEWAQKITLAFVIIISLAIVYASARALDIFPNSANMPVAVTQSASPAPSASPGQPTPAEVELPIETPLPTTKSTPVPATATPAPSGPASIRIGIVAGHHENDSGAICPDGLREVDINLAIAERIVGRLRRSGYTVDLLAEFDDRISGYQANVFLSVHTDSCIPGLTGFKIARSETSAIPEIEDQLVESITASYAEYTGLPVHADSISEHMRDYHAFREIAYDTPGAIIELGFMSDDRNLLLYRQDRLAKGLVRGIEAFLRTQNLSQTVE